MMDEHCTNGRQDSRHCKMKGRIVGVEKRQIIGLMTLGILGCRVGEYHILLSFITKNIGEEDGKTWGDVYAVELQYGIGRNKKIGQEDYKILWRRRREYWPGGLQKLCKRRREYWLGGLKKLCRRREYWLGGLQNIV